MKTLLFYCYFLFLFPIQNFCQNTEEEFNQRIGLCYSQQNMDCVIGEYKKFALWQKEKLGPDHKDYLNTIQALASLMIQQDRIGEAIPVIEEVLDAKAKIYGEDSEDVKGVATLFIMQLRAKGDEGNATHLEQRLKNNKPELTNPIAEINDLEALQQRKSHCQMLMDWECMLGCQQKIVQLLKREKSEWDSVYLEAIFSLTVLQITKKDWENIIVNVEPILAEENREKFSLSEEKRQQFQAYLNIAYQQSGKEPKIKNTLSLDSLLASRLGDNPTLDEVLEEMENPGPDLAIAFQSDIQAYGVYLGLVSELFSKRVETDLTDRHPKYEKILEKAIDVQAYLAMSKESPEDKSYYLQRSNATIDKVLSLVEKREGKRNSHYVSLLQHKANNYVFNKEPKKQLAVLEEAIVLSRQFCTKDNKDYQAILQQFLMLSAYFENNPDKEKFYESCWADYIPDENSEDPLPTKTMLYASKQMQAQAQADSVLTPMAFPNILDTFLLYPQKSNYSAAIDFIETHLRRLKPGLLSLGDDAANLKLLANVYRELEAILSFTTNLNKPQPELNGYVLQYAVQYSYLEQVRKERIQKRHFLKDDPKYVIPFQNWVEQKKLVNRFYILKTTEIKDEGRSLIWEERKLSRMEQQLAMAVDQTYKPPLPPNWKSLQAHLKPDEAFIEIVRFIQREPGAWTTHIGYAAIIVRPNLEYPQLVHFPDGPVMDFDLFQAYQNSRFNGDDGALYGAYWAPIEQYINGVKRVYLSPNGVYHKINLNSLKIPGLADKYLIDRLDIRLINNPLTLLRDRQPGQSVTDAVLIGDPLFDLNQKDTLSDVNDASVFRSPADATLTQEMTWPSLPRSAEEVNQIAAILKSKGIAVKSYLHEQAREQIVKQAKSPGILHLATHAYFSPLSDRLNLFDYLALPKEEPDKYPAMSALVFEKELKYGHLDTVKWNSEILEKVKMLTNEIWQVPQYTNPALNSALVFAGVNNPSETDDGILTAYEIYGLDLHKTELVNLSACNSGVSDLANGKGVAGLRGAFDLAGVNYIINNLWEVRDDVAQLFMVFFYENWLIKDQDINTAFRNAQLQIRARLPQNGLGKSQMYLWGAFVLVDL